jgi:hypothetical protein
MPGAMKYSNSVTGKNLSKKTRLENTICPPQKIKEKYVS